MIKSIICQSPRKQAQNIKVRVIKAPLVDTEILKEIMAQRQRALIL